MKDRTIKLLPVTDVVTAREYKSLLKKLRTWLQKKQRIVQSVKAIKLKINEKECSLFTRDVRQLKQMMRGKQLQATMKGKIALNLRLNLIC